MTNQKTDRAPAEGDALATAAAALVQAVQRDWPNTGTHRAAVLAAADKVQQALTSKAQPDDNAGSAEEYHKALNTQPKGMAFSDDAIRAGIRAFQSGHNGFDDLSDWRAFLTAACAAQGTGWRGMTGEERAAFVIELCECGTGFVSPLFSLVESLEDVLKTRNCAPIQARASANQTGQEQAVNDPEARDDDMLEPLIYAAIMHNGKPKTASDFAQASARVANMLKRRTGAAQAPAPAPEPYGYLRQTNSAANPPHGWAFHFAGRPGDVAVYLKAPAVGAGWRPMRTAPKDGTAILVLMEASDVPHAVRWDCAHDHGWLMTWDNYRLSPADGPRYWMPCPADPDEVQAPAVGADDAKDAARFRWLIDDKNADETNDTPMVCTSEDVHWGDKARALIDLHMAAREATP